MRISLVIFSLLLICQIGPYRESLSICFELQPCELSEKPSIELDESLEMPTVEIPESHITKANDLQTEHNLSDPERQLLFEAVQTLPATKEGQLGRTSLLKHKIELVPGAKPKKFPSYRWSPAVEGVIDAEVDRMKKLGVIEECVGKYATVGSPEFDQFAEPPCVDQCADTTGVRVLTFLLPDEI